MHFWWSKQAQKKSHNKKLHQKYFVYLWRLTSILEKPCVTRKLLLLFAFWSKFFTSDSGSLFNRKSIVNRPKTFKTKKNIFHIIKLTAYWLLWFFFFAILKNFEFDFFSNCNVNYLWFGNFVVAEKICSWEFKFLFSSD